MKKPIAGKPADAIPLIAPLLNLPLPAKYSQLQAHFSISASACVIGLPISRVMRRANRPFSSRLAYTHNPVPSQDVELHILGLM